MAADVRTGAFGTLVEREQELDRLGALLAAAAGGHGAAVLLEGTAGIGKTSLVAAARALAGDLGVEGVVGMETYDSPQPLSAAEADARFGVRLTRLEDFLRRQTPVPAR